MRRCSFIKSTVLLLAGLFGLICVTAVSRSEERSGGTSAETRPAIRTDSPQRIVFVCDASGSMLNKMLALKVALKKLIQKLEPSQCFNVIFFQRSRKDMLLFEKDLVAATPENQRRFSTFLQMVTTKGDTDPIPALELGFQQHPQLLYLVTDGDFLDNKMVLAKLRALNKNHQVRINTIALVNKDDKDVDFKNVLKTIASEAGGTYSEVVESDDKE
jgi:uncharacterized protein with von Willebrand factor type A (vWA) domain